MKILSLDTSADICAVSLCNDKKIIAEITVNAGNTHSQTLLPAIENVLRLAEIRLDEVEAFACTTGPGSFTGVRIGVATLKGLAYGKNKPCISVSAVEALAYNLIGYNGIICPVINARRSQVYNALFECIDGKITRLCDDRVIIIDELDQELSMYSQPIYLCGDGYDITLNGFNKAKCEYVPEKLRLSSGYSVSLCALDKISKNEILTDTTIAPIYLRPSQAERERQERLGKQ